MEELPHTGSARTDAASGDGSGSSSAEEDMVRSSDSGGEKHYAVVDTDSAEQSALSQLSTTFSQPELDVQKIVWQPIPVRLSRR